MTEPEKMLKIIELFGIDAETLIDTIVSDWFGFQHPVASKTVSKDQVIESVIEAYYTECGDFPEITEAEVAHVTGSISDAIQNVNITNLNFARQIKILNDVLSNFGFELVESDAGNKRREILQLPEERTILALPTNIAEQFRALVPNL